MSGIETYIPAPLNITEQAVTKVGALKVEEGNDDLKLRVYVTGGGCSGFSMASHSKMLWQKTIRL